MNRIPLLVSLAAALVPAVAGAATLEVRPGRPPALADAVAAAAPGDTVRVFGGTHPGPVVIDRPLVLEGVDHPVVDGGGRGTVVSVRAPDVTISGLVVRGSGISLDEEHAGITVDAPRARIAGNRLEEVLFGIYVREAPGSVVEENDIVGMTLDLARRGDAIRVWASDGVRVERNRVARARDVVLWYSSDLSVVGNRVREGRYGLHFMYCDDARIADNVLADNSVGAFLMYSRRLRFTHNTVSGNHGPSGYGIGLKDMDDAEVLENLFVGNRVGIFLDNSPREIDSRTTVAANLMAANDVGIRLMPNVRRATFAGNSLVENPEQVAIAGAGGDPTANAWTANHWSDYRGYDADRDGTGDVPYRSDRLFENLADRDASLRLFAWSPAVDALDFAARAFPLVRPAPKLVDETPRMAAMVPVGPPAVPRGSGGGLAVAAGLLLAAAGATIVAPRVIARLSLGASTAGLPPGRSPASTPGRLHALAPDARPLVTAAGLGKRFGELAALDDVAFTILEGQSVALWGENGAGKTTALRALLGVMPYEGSVRIGGFDTRGDGKNARRLVGFVPQETAFPDLRVIEALELFARLHRAPRERIPQLLDALGLAGEEEKAVQSLSGGRKQRLALAVALLADPPVLLLDEPTANLDVKARRDFLERLLALRAQGKTIIFSSHRPEEVRALADRVLVLEAGRLVDDVPAASFLVGGEAGTVELELVLAPAELADAEATLVAAGYRPVRRGRALALRVDDGRKVEPLALLLDRGHAVLDFRVEVSR